MLSRRMSSPPRRPSVPPHWSVTSPAFLRSASSFAVRSASAPFQRSASPFVRLERTSQLQAILGRLGEHQPGQALGADEVDVIDDEGGMGPAAAPTPVELTSLRSSGADARSYRPSFVSPRSTEYCCAICIELLLRPVVLSCGHRLCRGCWLRVLQGSRARVVASRTGTAACPLGRCEVRPCVPEIDQDLENEMQARLGFKQLAAHAAAAELAPSPDEESAAAAAVNAWAAAGCKLDRPEEISEAEATARWAETRPAREAETNLRWAEQAAAASAAAAYTRTLQERRMQRSELTCGSMRTYLRWPITASAALLFLLSLAGLLTQ